MIPYYFHLGLNFETVSLIHNPVAVVSRRVMAGRSPAKSNRGGNLGCPAAVRRRPQEVHQVLRGAPVPSVTVSCREGGQRRVSIPAAAGLGLPS